VGAPLIRPAESESSSRLVSREKAVLMLHHLTAPLDIVCAIAGHSGACSLIEICNTSGIPCPISLVLRLHLPVLGRVAGRCYGPASSVQPTLTYSILCCQI
jgi:hypothetical protein